MKYVYLECKRGKVYEWKDGMMIGLFYILVFKVDLKSCFKVNFKWIKNKLRVFVFIWSRFWVNFKINL